eukprot:scaffold1394_cov109-Isochrysis_galbana.AAC.13
MDESLNSAPVSLCRASRRAGRPFPTVNLPNWEVVVGGGHGEWRRRPSHAQAQRTRSRHLRQMQRTEADRGAARNDLKGISPLCGMSQEGGGGREVSMVMPGSSEPCQHVPAWLSCGRAGQSVQTSPRAKTVAPRAYLAPSHRACARGVHETRGGAPGAWAHS